MNVKGINLYIDLMMFSMINYELSGYKTTFLCKCFFSLIDLLITNVSPSEKKSE